MAAAWFAPRADAAPAPPTCIADANFAALPLGFSPLATVYAQLLALEDVMLANGVPGSNTVSAAVGAPLGCSTPVPVPPAEPAEAPTTEAPAAVSADAAAPLDEVAQAGAGELASLDAAPSLAATAVAADAPLFDDETPRQLKAFATWVLVVAGVAAVAVVSAGGAVVGRLRRT
jgi:hypothetical protein